MIPCGYRRWQISLRFIEGLLLVLLSKVCVADKGLGEQVTPGDSPYMVLPGTTAYLPCRGVAKPNVTAVTWYKNGAEVNRTSGRISSGTVDEPSLTISNVTKEDEGSYRCIATTKQGKTGQTTVLIVLNETCPSGKFGELCNESCGFCVKEVCNRTTGACAACARAGLTMPLCLDQDHRRESWKARYFWVIVGDLIVTAFAAIATTLMFVFRKKPPKGGRQWQDAVVSYSTPGPARSVSVIRTTPSVRSLTPVVRTVAPVVSAAAAVPLVTVRTAPSVSGSVCSLSTVLDPRVAGSVVSLPTSSFYDDSSVLDSSVDDASSFYEGSVYSRATSVAQSSSTAPVYYRVS